MSFAEIRVFEIEDLRKYIFSFLRLKAEKICTDCKDILVWDKKIQSFIEVYNYPDCYFKVVNDGIYCSKCYCKRLNTKCLIS